MRNKDYEAYDDNAPAPMVPKIEEFRLGRNDAIVVHTKDSLEIEPGLHRVVWTNRMKGVAYLLRFPQRCPEAKVGTDTAVKVSTGKKRVKHKLHMPTMVSLTALEMLGNSRQVVKVRAPVPRRLNQQYASPTDFEKKVRDKRKAIVKHFNSDADIIAVLEEGRMGRYVSEVVEEFNKDRAEGEPLLTRDHVYQVVLRYWLHCCREAALLPDSANCGAKGTYRNPGSAKRGRPPLCVVTGHAPNQSGVNTMPDIRDLIWVYWESHGGKMDKFSAAYQQLIKDQFTSEWKIDEKGLWVPDKETIADAPSIETFRYYIKKRYSPVELLRKIMPPIKWEQNKRALKGRAHDNLFGPAHTYVIDSTVADVYLVSQFNRYWVIGRPVVYFVRDVWSGMIVGMHVALEGPSWKTARFAIYNAFSPKGDFLRAHGFNMTDADWPCAHGSMNLLHDRGEQVSISSTDSANDLGLILCSCPPLRPDVKGPIETLFHWMNRATVQWMPGAVNARGKERGGRDYRLDAILTLYQFTRILINAVLTFNQTLDVSNRFDARMYEAGIENNPKALWNWGLENLNGSPPQWDRETLYSTLLPSGEAFVRKDGVYFSGKRYSGNHSDMAQWQEFARAFNNKKITVKYDTVRPHEIYVVNDLTGNYETLTLMKGQNIPANARLEDILDEVRYRKLIKQDTADVRALSWLSHKVFRDDEIAKATAQRAAQVAPDSKAEHLAGITDKRQLEAMLQRLMQAANGPLAAYAEVDQSPVSTDAQESVSDSTSRLIATLAEEASHVACD